MRSRAIKKTKRISKHSSILCLLLMSILLMGIGYAAINSITGEISGTIIAEQQNDVFITSVEYVSDVDADLAGSNITYYKGTYMQSTVKLSETNPNSEITYKVTVYNNSENTYPFLTTLFDEEFYDNPNIVFEIKDTGFKVGDLINGKETKEIYITFKYKDGVLPENKTLNSNINFKIANPNRLKKAESGGSTSNYLGSTITRDKIETVKFELGTLQPEGTVASFDASEKQDGSIIGYYTDTDSNGMYELTFLSAEPIAPNVNGQYLFQNLTNVKEITFNNCTTYGVTSMYGMFGYCSGLTELDLSSFDTSQVTDMSGMFSNCRGLTSLDLREFNTSKVTSMSNMFRYCRGLTNLDVSEFDTSQVTNMLMMFEYCEKLIELDVSGFETSQVTNMSTMFSNCSGLTELNVSGFETSQVTNMGSMFSYCRGLTKLDVSGFDTSQVTNMSYMFYGCVGLTEIDVSRFNTSQVTNMSSMFAGCKGLTEIDVSRIDTSKVTNMCYMFYNCNRLTELDLSSFDTSKVTDMNYMFTYCYKLTKLDLSSFDTSQVTNMSNMFSSCSKLTTIYVSEYDEVAGTGWTTSAVTSSSYMFDGCSVLVGQNGTAYNSSHTDAEYARIDKPGEPGYLTDITNKVNRLVLAEYGSSTTNYLGSTVTKDKIESIKFEKGTTMEAISSFDASEKQDGSIIGYYTDADNNGLYELTFLSEDPIAPNRNGQYLFDSLSNVTEITFNNFSTFGVTGMYSMFANCSKLTELDVSKFDTSHVTNMFGMFSECSGLTSLNISSFDTSKVTDTTSMFNRCSGLTSLDLSKWNTSQVTSMSGMFYSCSGLTELDVSGFDTKKVTDMSSMFYGCSGLTSLDLSKWNTSQVTRMRGMFYSCSGLTSLNISSFDTSKVTDTTSMFYRCSGLTSLDLSKWNTSQVTRMIGMFSRCSGLTSLNISGFDTSKVIDMQSMFNECSRLTSLDLSGFDTSQVTNMSSMFYGCRGLTTIYVSEYDEVTGTGWTTSAVTRSSDMFNGCSVLVGQNGTAYSSSHIDAEYARIDKPGGVSPSEIFDSAGTNPDGLHIGDFVNYDAGTWTQEEINAIQTGQKTNLVTANGSTKLPGLGFQFGGFTAGSSRNGNATPNDTNYNYVKDKETNQAITGWRVFDIEGDTVTLISAGNPEDYYHQNSTTSGYTSEYILTGNINSLWSNGEEEAKKYQKRDWGMYINEKQYGTSAGILTKEMLDEWYIKYTDTQNADIYTQTTFQKIYRSPYTKYQNMIDNYSYYWFASIGKTNSTIYDVIPYARFVYYNNNKAYGIRAIVTLASNAKFTENKAGTKTVTGGWTTSYGGDQNYNVWDFGEPGQPGYLTDVKNKPVSPSEIFDPEGTNPDGLHIGDFVNYDAGTWTEEEINSIQTGLKTSLVTANNSTSLPTQAFQFGGFTAGSSRNGNATPYNATYNYVKDAETGEAITGWRVFDVEGDTVTLISAGNPEDYYHPYVSGQNYSYVSEYILTGNINSSWSAGSTAEETYQKRNWDMYVNTSQYGESAGVLTKAMLDAWYTKYTDTPNANTYINATFRKIYEEPYTKYQNMIDNYSYYWLSSAFSRYNVYSVNPYDRRVYYDLNFNLAYGVRAVVSLKSNVQFTATKAGTKTVTGGWTTQYGGDQTYNVWDIY